MMGKSPQLSLKGACRIKPGTLAPSEVLILFY